MGKKHLFLMCKIHNRACFGEVWMGINPFLDMFIGENVKDDECMFTEVECDECVKEKIK